MSDLKLLLTPSQRQLLKDAAHRLGVREQVIARNAVLAALTGPAPIAAPKSSVVPSLNRIHAQLLSVAAALENITDALGEIDATDETETSAAIAASDAAAANGQRVARRILRGLEQPAGRAGASTSGTDATADGPAEAAGGSERKAQP